MERVLPRLQLSDDVFYVDGKLGLLRYIHDLDVIIELSQTERQDRNTDTPRPFLRILYDLGTRQLFIPAAGLQWLPEHVLYLEFPSDAYLDLIGYAQRKGQYQFWEDPQVDRHHVARVIPRVDIFGEEFFVDTINLRFQHVFNRRNIIPLDKVHMTVDNIFFDFDITTRALAVPSLADTENESVVLACLPGLPLLDKQGWALLHGDTSIYKLNVPPEPTPQVQHTKKAEDKSKQPGHLKSGKGRKA